MARGGGKTGKKARARTRRGGARGTGAVSSTSNPTAARAAAAAAAAAEAEAEARGGGGGGGGQDRGSGGQDRGSGGQGRGSGGQDGRGAAAKTEAEAGAKAETETETDAGTRTKAAETRTKAETRTEAEPDAEPRPDPDAATRAASPDPSALPASQPARSAVSPATSGSAHASAAAPPRSATPTPAPAAPPAAAFEIAVAESSQTNQQRACELLAELGYRVADAGDDAAMRARLERGAAPAAMLIGLPEGADLCAACLAAEPDRPVVIAALSAPAATARARTAAAGADLFTVRPHSRDSLAAVLLAAEALAGQRGVIRAVRGSEALLRERLARFGHSDLADGFFHVELFERVLMIELKRARRYGYSLAACLIGLDAFQAPAPPPPGPAGLLRRQVATAIVNIVRDIDMPVELADDRMLVFLPWTNLDGATRVGRRIAEAVAACEPVVEDGHSWPMSVSIGIAALKQGKPVSFARLMRDAHAALRAARLKGGDQVVVRT